MADLSAYEGRLAIVTGAGDGIGRMLAEGFAAAGMRVCVLDIREDAAQTVAESLGGGSFAVAADVSDRSSMEAASTAIKDRGEDVGLVWINAGVGLGASILEGSQRGIEWGYGVNVLGAIWSAQTLVPLLLESDGPGHVGVTASTASLRQPEAPLTLYGATKQATFAVGEALMCELEPRDIGVTILCPGLLNTDIWDAARARPERFGGPRSMDPSIAGTWREALSPDMMWPHIAETVATGGGYLTCATSDDTPQVFRDRAALIEAGMVVLS